MPSSSVPLPRHQGLGGLIKTIAKSRKLKTEDVKGVIADLHKYAVAGLKKGNPVEIPQLTSLKLKRPPPPRFERMLNSAENTLPDETL